MTATVEIYTWRACPFCIRAKALLDRKGVTYTEFALDGDEAARAAMEHGLRKVEVLVKGPGSGRDTALRSLQSTGIEVSSIKDVTPVPHNGCRQPKRRRT